MTIEGMVGTSDYLQEIDERYQVLEKKYPDQKEKINVYKTHLICLIKEFQQDASSYKISRLIQDQFSSDDYHLSHLQSARDALGAAAASSSLNRAGLKDQLSFS